MQHVWCNAAQYLQLQLYAERSYDLIEALLRVHEQVDSRMLKKPVGPFHNLTLRCYL